MTIDDRPWQDAQPVDGLPETTVEAEFEFLGVRVRVRCDAVPQLQHWRSVLAAFTVAPGRPPDVVVRAHGVATAGNLTATVEHSGGVHAWDGSGPLVPPLDLPLFDRWALLQGAVVSRSGHGVLVLGPSGSGKTRLVLSEVARGALVVADGTVPVAVGDLLAHPFPVALRLRSEDLHALGIPRTHPALWPFTTRSGQVQWRADSRALFPSRAARTATEITALVVVRDRAGDGPGLLTVPPDTALEWLLQHLHRPVGRPAEVLDALVRLARSVPAHVLSPAATTSADRLLDPLLA